MWRTRPSSAKRRFSLKGFCTQPSGVADDGGALGGGEDGEDDDGISAVSGFFLNR